MEILFRGFHKQADGPDVAMINGVAELGWWFEGSLVKMGPVGYTHYYILPDYASAFYEIEVIPSTIGQWTGLTDKNGKKIFSGDIGRNETSDFTIKCGLFMPRKFCKVEYRNERDIFGFYAETKNGQYVLPYNPNLTVIGTIYDAPPEGARDEPE